MAVVCPDELAELERRAEADRHDPDALHTLADYLEEHEEPHLAATIRLAVDRGWHEELNRTLNWDYHHTTLFTAEFYNRLSFAKHIGYGSLLKAYRRLAFAVEKAGGV